MGPGIEYPNPFDNDDRGDDTHCMVCGFRLDPDGRCYVCLDEELDEQEEADEGGEE